MATKTKILAQNNFDLLRFLFAVIVFLVHAHTLSGSEDLAWISKLLSAEVAVKSFFVVSGFLIFMSYENSTSLGTYFEKRIRRIYPAYFIVVVGFGFFAVLLTDLSLPEYFLSNQFYKYLLSNLLFLNFLSPNLPGIFEENLYQAVNGALWTLKIEVMFYLVVPLMVLFFKRAGYGIGISMVYLGSFIYSMLLQKLAIVNGEQIYYELQRQLPGQLMYFMGGAFAYYFYSEFRQFSKIIFCSGLTILAIEPWLPLDFLEPLAISTVVIYIALFFRHIGNFAKFGDFSYGIYIIHFPILQSLILIGFFKTTPLTELLLTAILILVMSYALWHLIEKPWLKSSSHYLTSHSR